MNTYIRLDEQDKTPKQIAQREATYKAVKLLKAAGYNAIVQEYFTGKSETANAAGIIIEL